MPSSLEQKYKKEGVMAEHPLKLSICTAARTASPLRIFEMLGRSEPHAFLLENLASSEDANQTNDRTSPAHRVSIIGFDPALTITMKNGTAVVRNRAGDVVERHNTDDPLQLLKRIIDGYRACIDVRMYEELKAIPFIGGLVGYAGYGVSHYLEGIPKQQNDPLGIPELCYGFYDSCLVFDQHKLTAISLQDDAQVLLRRALEVQQVLDVDQVNFASSSLSTEEVFSGVQANFSKVDYVRTVNTAKEHITQGQTFQIVVAQRFAQPANADPINVYEILQHSNPSPYGYYLKFPDFVYLGASPETFLQCYDNTLQLQVIAGTRPRGKDAEEDRQLEQELLHNEKEMAEHKMLVDLGRNDLGRVSVPGTVEIGHVAQLFKYSHVMHLVTQIKAILSPDYSVFDAFKSCFPAGTVSGAPKIRAMELLEQLEPEQRGVYSGAVGYFDLRGNADSAIAIRSALIKDGLAHVHAGAGIVYDSDAEMEYEECRHKAKAVLQAIKVAELIACSASGG